jgi:hypothetical protein
MRRSAAANQAGVSLFPFLAVLLCTMGALIVLLVVVNRNSRDEAARERLAQKSSSPPIAVAKQSEPATVPPVIDTADQAAKIKAAKELKEKIETLADQRDELNWRSEHLAEISKKNLTDLQNERARLSSSEELVRELTKQVENLANSIKSIQQNGIDKSQTAQQLTNDLQDTEQQLALAKQKLLEAQQAVAKQKPLYSVVPYDGPNRTNRRPIYIECTRDKIILQPEGIILSPLDFVGPSGPGNPLASTIRTMRDHLVQNAANPQAPDAEPYPLFIVRPDGIMAYYEAREAMASWANEIGYQAVDADWPLAYPDADPVLQQKATVALNEARERFRWLAQSNQIRSSLDAQPKKTLRVASTGGGLVAENDPFAGREMSWAKSLGMSGMPGTGPGMTGNSATGTGNNSTAGSLGQSATGQPIANGSGYAGTTGATGMTAGSGYGSTSTTGGSSSASGNGSYLTPISALPYGQLSNGTGLGGSGAPGSGTSGNAGGTTAGQGTAGTSTGNGLIMPSMNGGVASTGQASTSGAGSPGSGASETSGGATGSGAAGMSSASNSTGQPANGNLSVNQSLATNQPANATTGPTTRQFGEYQPGASNSSSGASSSAGATSLANSRGANWAIASQPKNSTPISRPVRIRCEANQLVLLADLTAEDAQRTVPVTGPTVSAIPQFVKTVEERVERWGLAGKNMYWSPELIVEVTSDAEQRYSDLEKLMENSGWIVKRKSVPIVEGPTLLQATRPSTTTVPAIPPIKSPSSVDGRALPPFRR